MKATDHFIHVKNADSKRWLPGWSPKAKALPLTSQKVFFRTTRSSPDSVLQSDPKQSRLFDWPTLRTLWILALLRLLVSSLLESEPHVEDTRLVHSLLPSLVVRPELQRWHMKTDRAFPLSDGDFDPSDRIYSFSSFRWCLRRPVSVLTPTSLRLWRVVPVVRLDSRGAHWVTVPLIHWTKGRVNGAVGPLFSCLSIQKCLISRHFRRWPIRKSQRYQNKLKWRCDPFDDEVWLIVTNF